MSRTIFLLVAVLAVAASAAEPVRPFTQTLTVGQQQRLGLAGLSAAQRAELDAAIRAYTRGETTVAVRQAVQEAERTSAAKVESKKKPDAEPRERFTVRVVGPFRGWSGGTYFPLENGQVWRQVGTESNERPVEPNAEIEIYQSPNGYWRLSYGGTWITVKRLQ